MEIRSLPADEAVIRRYVEELWLPYHRELEATVDAHALADEVDLVGEEVEFRLDQLDSENHRTWVTFDEDSGDGGDLAAGEGKLAGFITAEITESPSVFDQPDTLHIGDIYVHEQYRGTGLAHELIDYAAEWAREAKCTEMTLDVDIDNERAIAFYETLGFETLRRHLSIMVDDR